MMTVNEMWKVFESYGIKRNKTWREYERGKRIILEENLPDYDEWIRALTDFVGV